MACGRIALPFRLIFPFCFLFLLLSPDLCHPATDSAMPPGDAAAGRRLFTGEQRFQNGGAPCIGCHNVAGLSGGGGVLGPDMSDTFSDYGAEGLASALAEIPFPTMKPIYANRPLLPGERAHVTEFLRAAGGTAPGDAKNRPVLVALGGVAALVLLLLAFGRGRLGGVRKPLVSDRTGRGGDIR